MKFESGLTGVLQIEARRLSIMSKDHNQADSPDVIYLSTTRCEEEGHLDCDGDSIDWIAECETGDVSWCTDEERDCDVRYEKGTKIIGLRAEVERLEDDNKALLNIRQCYLENEKELNEIDELLGVSEQIDYSTDQRVKDILSDRKWLGKQHLKDRVAVERMVSVVKAVRPIRERWRNQKAATIEQLEKLAETYDNLDREEKGEDDG